MACSLCGEDKVYRKFPIVMAKRKVPSYFGQAVAEDDTDEEDSEGDNERRVSSIREKRQRRVSDVIDSKGEREDTTPEGFTTPRRHLKRLDMYSPDQGYSASPDLRTPDSVKAFMPDWLNKTPDLSDAAPNTFGDQLTTSVSSSLITASMSVAMDADCYNMNHKYRGKCVVFNHEYFDTGFDDRAGSSVDAKRIQQTFQNLGFEVEILDNLVHAEVIEKINKLSEEDHGDSDCLCIFVLTHGIANDMIFAKDVAYMADKIWKPFTADKCKTLAGKPKLFFFQACRGDELDDGVTLACKRNLRMTTETDSVLTTYKIPTHADFLIAHSSAQGFSSWRNPTEGTWFVQCLCGVLDEYADRMDLLKMLTITARKISTERASYHDTNLMKHDKKQVPSITTMLLRDVYFTPK